MVLEAPRAEAAEETKGRFAPFHTPPVFYSSMAVKHKADVQLTVVRDITMVITFLEVATGGWLRFLKDTHGSGIPKGLSRDTLVSASVSASVSARVSDEAAPAKIAITVSSMQSTTPRTHNIGVFIHISCCSWAAV